MISKSATVFFALLFSTMRAFSIDLHVSPDGNDVWSGKLERSNAAKTDGPVASLAGARDAVRKARAAGERGAVRVVFAGGEYPLAEPVVFEPQDGGVRYESVPGAKPVFVGGKKITGWKLGNNGMWTAKVDPAWRFEALWVNGKRAPRERWPREGYITATGLPSAPLAGELAKTALQIAPKDAEFLRGLSAEQLREVNVVVLHTWNESRHRIAGVRFEDGTLQFTGGSRAFFSLAPYHRLWFENVRPPFESPGEWFLARDGTVFYNPLPGENIELAEIIAPVAKQWMVFKGDPAKDDAVVRDLKFCGLTFRFQHYELPAEGMGYNQAEHGLGAAIEADSTRDVTFEKCAFEHTMTNAVWLRRGCRDIALRDCFFHELGAGGVKIGEKDSTSDTTHTSHVTIDNCIIHSGGRYFTSAIGVLIFHSSDCTVSHCDIADFFYSTISIGWVWGYKPTPCARNVVEFCHLHHVGWGVLSDMAGVYTLGPQPGTVIRNCHIHDIGCASYGAWGMYNDEGSTGVVWENNLVHDTQDAGYHQHYGRDNIVRNCIVAFCAEEHLRRSKPEAFHAFTIERNIVLLGDGKLFAQADKNWLDGNVTLDRNVYWKPGGAEISFAGKSFTGWQEASGNDRNSVVADPLFIAPEKGDWTLRPNSPALKLGFIPFDWKLAGVTGDSAWRQLAGEKFPPMKFGVKQQVPPLRLHDGFEETAVGAQPNRAHTTKQLRDPVRVVAGGGSKGARCLLLSDSAEAEPSFEPYFFYQPNHSGGITRVAFDVKLEAAYRLVHQWRDEASPYRIGPMLTFENGALSVLGRKLAELPPNEWVHVEVTARLGAQSDGTFSVALTLPGKPSQKFDGLKFVKPMRELKWLGFSSPGNESAKCWLDEIEIENKPAE